MKPTRRQRKRANAAKIARLRRQGPYMAAAIGGPPRGIRIITVRITDADGHSVQLGPGEMTIGIDWGGES